MPMTSHGSSSSVRVRPRASAGVAKPMRRSTKPALTMTVAGASGAPSSGAGVRPQRTVRPKVSRRPGVASSKRMSSTPSGPARAREVVRYAATCSNEDCCASRAWKSTTEKGKWLGGASV